MAFENKKICITGHTKGVGKAIKERLEQNHYTVGGGSRKNGINVGKPKSVINWILKEDPDVFINNVYWPDSQAKICYQLYNKWQSEKKHIINMSSTSGMAHTNFNEMANSDITRAFYNEFWGPYVSEKNRLDFIGKQLSHKFSRKFPCKVTSMMPGFVDTNAVALFKPVFTPESFLTPEEVAQQVHWLIEQPDHIHIHQLAFGTYFEISQAAARQRLKDFENMVEEEQNNAYGLDEKAVEAGKEGREALKKLINKRIMQTTPDVSRKTRDAIEQLQQETYDGKEE